MSDSTMPIAVVTGASSGIGAAAAKKLAGRGWRVVLVARGKQALEETCSAIVQSGGDAVVDAIDASDGDAVLAMAARVNTMSGDVELIVNSAGAGQWRFIEETVPAEALQMMSAPYHAAFNVTHAFMPGMLERRRGVIMHINSPACLMPWPGCTGYAATRWALRGLHEALCQDLRGTGVISSHVILGEVSSPYFENNPGTHEHLPKIAKMIPVSTPEQCADIIAGVAEKPRTEVVFPFMLRLFAWMNTLVPSLVGWLVGSTGRQH